MDKEDNNKVSYSRLKIMLLSYVKVLLSYVGSKVEFEQINRHKMQSIMSVRNKVLTYVPLNQ